MDKTKNELKIGRYLIYLVVIGFIFICGTAVGLAGSKWLWGERGSPTAVPAMITATVIPTSLAQVTKTPPDLGPGPTPCSPLPAGWGTYEIQPGDTLSELVTRFGTSQTHIMQVNCLDTPTILAGQFLYLPLPPTSTPCVPDPPAGWGLYLVQAGDNLTNLAKERGVPTAEVTRVNCLNSSNITEGQSLYLPVRATATPCVPSPPAGWGLYTVQGGDNLFSLATARGVTVAEVTQVNCLTSTDLVAGETLYLPPLPPSPTPLPPPPTIPPLPTIPPQVMSTPIAQLPLPEQQTAPGAAPSTSATSPTSAGQPQPAGSLSPFGRLGSLPPFAFLSAEPNDPTPDLICQEEDPEDPYLDIFEPNDNIELGDRRYFFACGFPASPSSASLTRNDGLTQPVELLDTIPFFDLDESKAQAVIDFPALPFYPTSRSQEYRLVVTDTTGVSAEIEFWVIPPTKEYILPEPEAGSPGTIFLVYYVNYELDTTPEFHLFGPVPPGQLEATSTLPHRDILQVTITQPLVGGGGKQGWAVAPLPSSETDLRGTYAITYHQQPIGERIWLR